jgi:phage gpG-like protein
MLQRVGQWRIKETMKTFSGQFKPNMPVILANEIQNHFVEGFRLGGYRTNASMGGWRSRQFTKGKGTRGILIGKGSGVLRRDIRKRITTFNLIVVGTSALTDDYATIHNEGGKIKITAKMRRYFWAMFHELSNKTSYIKTTGQLTKSSIGKSNEAEYWLNLAMHKGSHIIIPKREFIGDSNQLLVKLEKRLDQEILKLFK